jgi:hypothetical protein
MLSHGRLLRVRLSPLVGEVLNPRIPRRPPAIP